MGYDGQQLSFVGHVERIESENLARPFDRFAHGDLPFADDHPDLGTRGDFIQGRGDAATGRKGRQKTGGQIRKDDTRSGPRGDAAAGQRTD
jgi:hypothetical protein